MLERIRAWYGETHGIHFELTRHFFVRLFDSDLITTPGQLRALLIGIFAALASFGLIMPMQLYRKYLELGRLDTRTLFDQAALADKLFFIGVAMVVVGFVTALEWHALFPDLQDYLILGHLPVSMGQIFVSKFASMMLFISIFTVSLNLYPSMGFPSMMQGFWLPTVTPAHVLGHFAATCAASLFVFFSLVALQGALMNTMSARLHHRVSLYAQLILLLLLLCAAPMIFSIPSLYANMSERPAWGLWAPPLWFLGLYEALLGSREPYALELAGRALMGIVISAAATLVLYYISYRRHSARIVEGPGRSGRRADSNGREIPFLTMPQFGFLSFAWKTLTRSRQHKMFLGLYAGIGCAVVIDAFIGIATARSFQGLGVQTPELVQATLSVPLVMAFCLVSGMRYVYGLPSELRANWLFKMAEDDGRAQLLDTVELTYLAALAPVLLLTFPAEAWILGAGRAVTHLIVSALLCLILIEAALLNLRKLPFVCSYLPGKINPSQLIVIYWLAFSTFVFTMTGLEAWCFRDPPRVLVLVGLLTMAWPLARRLRLADWGLTPLMYDDALEPEVYLLGIER